MYNIHMYIHFTDKQHCNIHKIDNAIMYVYIEFRIINQYLNIKKLKRKFSLQRTKSQIQIKGHKNISKKPYFQYTFQILIPNILKFL